MAVAMTAQSGTVTTRAADARTTSKARFIATCVLVSRTGLIDKAIAPPTFWSVSREVRVWDRFAETRTSVRSWRAIWVTWRMSSALTEVEATKKQSASCSRTSCRRSPRSPTTASLFVGAEGSIVPT
jgi:hypothetical protein